LSSTAGGLKRPGYTGTKPTPVTVHAMSYALVEDVAASWESYERFAADIERSNPDGLILHAAGRTDEGFRIIEVWESEEAWRRFAERRDRPSAPRFIRELQPTHLVLGREVITPNERRKS
jgi:hypothetical protein